MSEIKYVFYGMAGQLKGKFKSPLIVYEHTENAKEFANNYTDLNKEPKVIQFKVENPRVIDLTIVDGKKAFEEIIKSEGLENDDVINFQRQYFDDVAPTIEILDTLILKKVMKPLSERFDIVKGYSILDDEQVSSFVVLNTEILKDKEVLEIDLEGDLWKVEFKK